MVVLKTKRLDLVRVTAGLLLNQIHEMDASSSNVPIRPIPQLGAVLPWATGLKLS